MAFDTLPLVVLKAAEENPDHRVAQRFLTT
jgi:hypothetical protein